MDVLMEGGSEPTWPGINLMHSNKTSITSTCETAEANVAV